MKTRTGTEMVDKIKVQVKPPLEEVAFIWKHRSKTLSNLEPAHKKVAVYFDQFVQRNFKDEGANLEGGDVWPAFIHGGRVVLGDIDSSAKLLQLTGRLKFSFLPFSNKDNAGIGSKLLYSKTHNEGLDRTGVPKRRILPIDSEVTDRIREILTAHGKKSLGLE